MRKQIYSAGILLIFVFALVSFASAQMSETDYNVTSTGLSSNNPNPVVQVLKYDPFPVNAGDWFDLWVKVQNIGQTDATDARFELIPDYPFSSDDNLVRDYGLIYGAVNAYKIDQTYDSSQVILKYRVKVADSAPVGESNIKLSITSNANSGFSNTVNLPIEIAKTKTDFDVVMQESTSQGVSFAISNIGDNDASALTVTIEPSISMIATGPTSSIIGNLAKGDFTTVTFQLSQSNRTGYGGNRTSFGGYPGMNQTYSMNRTSNPNEATVLISYTDVAGIRNTITKTVQITSATSSRATTAGTFSRTTTPSIPSYVYIIIGIIAGVVGFIVYNKVMKNKKA